MSVCTFIAADIPLPEVKPLKQYPIQINIDHGTIYDGGTDDNYYLYKFENTDFYTDKKYAVSLEWNYTEGRSKQIIDYIKTALKKTDTIELWHVWLTDYYEFEDRPYIHKKSISITELTNKNIKELDNAPIWNIPDKMYPDRPSFYCLTIKS